MEALEEAIIDAVSSGSLDRARALIEGRDRSVEAEPVVVDQDALLTLASMGFELEACNVALAVYKNMETAMEMLLSGEHPYSVDVGGVEYMVDLGRGALADRAAASALSQCLRRSAEVGDMTVVQWVLDVASAHPEMRCTLDVGTGWGPVQCHMAIADTPVSDPKLEAGIGARGTPIMVAAQSSHLQVVRALALHRANVDVLDTYGNRPLHFAASAGNLPLLKVLLSEGASLERRNKLSFTPLHVAVQNDQHESAAMLLERRADPLSTTNTLSSSLHLAARQGSQRSVELLLEHRADVDVPGLEGATPLHMALSQGHSSVVELLLSRGASLSGALFKAVGAGNAELVMDLIARAADPGERDGEGRTALHFAVAHPQVLDILVNARTPMTPDVCGRTPLHEVARSGNAPAAKSLLAALADPNFKDSDGKTPLDIARSELEKVWSHEARGEEKHADWFEWAHDQFGASMANIGKKRDLPSLVAVLETATNTP